MSVSQDKWPDEPAAGVCAFAGADSGFSGAKGRRSVLHRSKRRRTTPLSVAGLCRGELQPGTFARDEPVRSHA